MIPIPLILHTTDHIYHLAYIPLTANATDHIYHEPLKTMTRHSTYRSHRRGLPSSVTINERNLMFEKKILKNMNLAWGPFKRVKTCANGPKVIFLFIKAYFWGGGDLPPERSPAARRCVCNNYYLITILFPWAIRKSEISVSFYDTKIT